MQPYRFTMKYIPGPKNIADSLSRLLCAMPPSEHKDQTEEYVKWVPQESTPVALTTREIERALEHDPELKSVRECLLDGKWHALEFKEYLPVRGELSAINWKASSSWNSNCDTKATSLLSTRVGTRRSPRNRSNEATFEYQSVVARHRQRGRESL